MTKMDYENFPPRAVVVTQPAWAGDRSLARDVPFGSLPESLSFSVQYRGAIIALQFCAIFHGVVSG